MNNKVIVIIVVVLLIILVTIGIVAFDVLGKGKDIHEKAEETIDSSDMSELEIQTFNSTFTRYEGEEIKGSEVKSFISMLKMNEEAIEKGIQVSIDGTKTQIESLSVSKIKTSATYSVKLEYNGQPIVQEVIINENI